jgi:hypothetical protein
MLSSPSSPRGDDAKLAAKDKGFSTVSKLCHGRDNDTSDIIDGQIFQKSDFKGTKLWKIANEFQSK